MHGISVGVVLEMTKRYYVQQGSSLRIQPMGATLQAMGQRKNSVMERKMSEIHRSLGPWVDVC